MKRNASLCLAVALVLAGAGLWIASCARSPGESPAVPKATTPTVGAVPKEIKVDPKIAALVAQLGVADFETRRAAKAALMDLPGTALDAVRTELQKYPNDPEIKMSGEEVIKALAIRASWEKGVKEFTNTIGMKLVLVPAGEFLMGSPAGEKGRQNNVGPQHKVKITKAFYMGSTEVTQAQWKAVMGTNPCRFEGDDLPIEQVSWDDCQEFLKKLSEKEGKTYRLPTEAEWEYACRAGSTTLFYYVDDDEKLGEYAWYDKNSAKKTHSVGTKKPNAWGLYDISGNVWEWCQDWIGKYPQDAVTDPTGPAQGAFRVLRGGSWIGYPQFCRSAYRNWNSPDSRFDDFGFRVVLAVSSKTP